MSYKNVVMIICSLIICISSGCATNPITGDRELMLVSENEDLEIGQKYSPEIEKQLGGKITDSTMQTYINNIGQNIVTVSHRSDWEYHFTAVDDDSVNAFALPGGYVFITKGLLKNLQTEAQLAAILGHEIVHIVARDTANVMSRDIGINILLSAVTTEETSETVKTVASLSAQILGLKYSRADERTADLGGLNYMVQAGYNPQGMVETMQILQALHGSSSIDFFSTHPSPENRIGYISEEIASKYRNHANARTAKEDYQRNVLNRLN